jgi:protein gp37
MAENSKIEWCHHTFNPWIGCTKVSEGCAHCYAEKSSPARVMRANGHETWGKGAMRSLTSAANWKEPLKWNDQGRFCDDCEMLFMGKTCVRCEKKTARPRVFCASLADWLDDEVPIEWLAELMDLIVRTPNLDWLLLTKRLQNWERRITDALAEVEGIQSDWPSREPYSLTGHWLNEWIGGNAPANVWLGTTVENQARADERIPQLLSIPAKVRFLSCEPLLSDLNFWPPVPGQEGAMTSDWSPKGLSGIHWVICGGESGPGARPMHPDWARSLRDQCASAYVPFFFKQWGDWGPYHLTKLGKKKNGRVLDGRTHDEFPKVERSTEA